MQSPVDETTRKWVHVRKLLESKKGPSCHFNLIKYIYLLDALKLNSNSGYEVKSAKLTYGISQ